MTEGSRLSVIIVSYACRDVLAACLLSLRDALTSDDEVIVVDNDSPDGTAEMVRTSFPDVRLIESRANVGFAAGVNVGVSIATGRLTLILNPDTRVSALAVDQLIDCLDGLERDAMIGPTLPNGDGSVQRSAFRFPTPFVLASEQLSLMLAIKTQVYGSAHPEAVAVMEEQIKFYRDTQRDWKADELEAELAKIRRQK